MKVGKNQLVTLDDGKKYINKKKKVFENNKFYLLAGVLEDESDLNNEFQVAREVIFEGDTYLEEVDDPELLNKILPLFDQREGE